MVSRNKRFVANLFACLDITNYLFVDLEEFKLRNLIQGSVDKRVKLTDKSFVNGIFQLEKLTNCQISTKLVRFCITKHFIRENAYSDAMEFVLQLILSEKVRKRYQAGYIGAEFPDDSEGDGSSTDEEEQDFITDSD